MYTVQYTNTWVFERVLTHAMTIHPVVHDNGSTVVMRTARGTLTMDRQSMTEVGE